jgi:hypothetical protein
MKDLQAFYELSNFQQLFQPLLEDLLKEINPIFEFSEVFVPVVGSLCGLGLWLLTRYNKHRLSP